MFSLKLNVFDKICVVLAILLGMVLGILGILGVFVGCNANFTLPPVLGVLPLFVGWGIIKGGLVAWRLSDERKSQMEQQG
jgi:hypothetical protein